MHLLNIQYACAKWMTVKLHIIATCVLIFLSIKRKWNQMEVFTFTCHFELSFHVSYISVWTSISRVIDWLWLDPTIDHIVSYLLHSGTPCHGQYGIGHRTSRLQTVPHRPMDSLSLPYCITRHAYTLRWYNVPLSLQYHP